MAPPFEATWSTLGLADVQAFLDREVEEGLTWEAKGQGPGELRPEQIRKAASGFANAIGGSLILGAQREGDRWQLPGIDFPGGEASPWLSNILRELAPVPRYDVKVLSTSTGIGLVAVIAIEPVDVPPCMSGGSVFERVSGATVPVTDPAVLRSLFARGEAAQERSMKLAARAALETYSDPQVPHQLYRIAAPAEVRSPGRAMFGLAMAPVAWPRVCRSAVFTKNCGDRLLEIAAATQPGQHSGRASLEQTRSLVQATMPSHGGYWVVRVYQEGAASVAYGSTRIPEHPNPEELMSPIEKAWRLAVDALMAIGAGGEACLALHLRTTRYPPDGKWPQSRTPTMDVVATASGSPPSAAALAQIRRQLDREAGYTVWDPEDGG